MGQGLHHGVVAGVPTRRADVQAGHHPWHFQPESVRQYVAEQVVIAEPQRLRAEAEDEVDVVLQLLECELRVVMRGDRVSKVGTHLPTDAGFQQEPAMSPGPAGQDLLGQVLVNTAYVAGELGD
jgi:hypothetical protein